MKHIANPWVHSLGTYEPGRPIEEVARELGFENIEEVVKIASNENSLGPSPKAVEAMIRSAPRMHLYPDGGAFYLRRALAERLRVHMDEILVGNGSNEIIELMGHVFLQPGSNIVMADRAFVVYKLITAAMQAQTISVPMTNYTHDLDAMLEAITPETRIVFVANPNNPTGTMVNGAELDRFMARVPDHVVVALDEAYIELLPPSQQPDTLKYVRQGRHVYVLRTFSKTYGLAGLRVGYAVASRHGIELLHRVRQPFNVNAMALEAARAALEDEAYVERTRKMVREGLEQLAGAFDEMKLEYVPSVANFILVKVGRGREVFEALQRRKVIVRPMDGYGLPDHVRVTVGLKQENERFLQGLRAILAERGGA
ncbi:MAG TPA: histidinol-phosphate transaminase [Kiritimatiellia bacterium]|nr:histidinol-phosphate transaminase [Kiritimatiellia bacterium]HRZ13273.1 histidinol-phosphate transaminase [Kiritimatiellia bacterium]HSA18722.1 histidinol-phosphate transaminase [Kiritimatiellia bacterium]